VNTVTARNTPTPIDWLDGYERLLEWARLAQISEDKVLTVLSKQAADSPPNAARALTRLKQFREALYTAYTAQLSGTRVPQAVLSEINDIWQEAHSRLRLEYSGDRVEARASVEASDSRLCGCPSDRAVELASHRSRAVMSRRSVWLALY
jgi:hypothetical protein